MHPRTILGLALVMATTVATQAQAAPGDMNCDNTVDGLDVGPLVLALIEPSAYEAAYPGCQLSYGDFDCDGGADTGDISGFVECLLTGNCAACAPTGMVLVPAGEFLMGDFRNEGGTDERPAHVVFVSPFCIDACEVTNQQYADGLNWAMAQGGMLAVSSGVVFQAGSGTNYPYCDTATSSLYSRITWNGSTFGVVVGQESHPMVMVSWYGAVAYCNWRSAIAEREPCFDLSSWGCDFTKNGFRLPTESEWEKAAGWDPGPQRSFRFGEHTDGCGVNCLDGDRANYGSSGDPFEVGVWPYTTPVGFYDGSQHGGYQTQDAESFYGCRDMSGGVWEWCYDWYSSAYYLTLPASDPTGPASGTDRAQRGGSWYNALYSCRTSFRNHFVPDGRNPNDGFRCTVGSL